MAWVVALCRPLLQIMQSARLSLLSRHRFPPPLLGRSCGTSGLGVSILSHLFIDHVCAVVGLGPQTPFAEFCLSVFTPGHWR